MRQWARPGSRLRNVPGDAERGPRLFELMKHERFLCDSCGMMHELIEHRECRNAEAARPNPGHLPRAVRQRPHSPIASCSA
jgi:hypothetical protein